MEIESTETPRQERYLISALVESADQLNHVVASVKAAGATVVKSEALGLRKLSFTIAKKAELELVSVFFEAEPSTIKALESGLKNDSVLKRFLLTKWAVDPNATPVRKNRKPVGAGA